jgi:hypothetical protein
MFVGHGFVAFALAAGLGHAAGWSRERALSVGLLAGLFGLAPDVDMAYALVGLAGADTAMGAATGFWSASTTVHRVVTHSFVVGGVAAVAAGALASQDDRLRAVSGLALAALVVVAALATGALAAGVMALFVVAVALLAVGGRRAGVTARTAGVAAAVGLLAHPPGDLLTGEPPAFLYPLDVTLVAARPDPFADPTLNLLAPLFLELATFWVALGVYLWVSDGLPTLRAHLRGRAALGLGFAGVAVLLPPPTLDVSYHFVFPLVGVGLLTAAPWPVVEVSSLGDLREQPLAAAATGLTAVTLAALAYTAVYLLW